MLSVPTCVGHQPKSPHVCNDALETLLHFRSGFEHHGSIVGEQLEPELELGSGFPVVPFAADFAVNVGMKDRLAHPFWPRQTFPDKNNAGPSLEPWRTTSIDGLSSSPHLTDAPSGSGMIRLRKWPGRPALVQQSNSNFLGTESNARIKSRKHTQDSARNLDRVPGVFSGLKSTQRKHPAFRGGA